MRQGAVQYAIWISCTLLQVVLLLAILRRKLVPEFPLFFWYTVIHVVYSPIAYVATLTSEWGYFYLYWSFEGVDAVLTLFVIQSVFLKIFESYDSLRGLGTIVFRSATICLCVFAVVTAIYSPGHSPYWLMNALLIMERSIELVELGLLVCLFFFSRVFGLPWRHYIYGIVLGFGLSASIGLVSAALRTQLGAWIHQIFSWALSSAYTLGVVTWAYYFLSPKAVEISAKPPNSAQLQAWNEALAGILRK